MDGQEQAALNTAEQVATSMAPVLLAAAATTSPQAQAVAAVAPVVLQMLQAGIAAQSAGTMTPAELTALFAKASAGLQATHDAWANMDKPAA